MVTNVVEKFTHARSHYVQGQVEDALIALSGVQLDLSFLEDEFHHRTGNAFWQTVRRVQRHTSTACSLVPITLI
jgi:hypothetical protein